MTARKIRVDTRDDRVVDELAPKRQARKRKSISVQEQDGSRTQLRCLWVAEKLEDPVHLAAYDAMWDMLVELARPRAIKYATEYAAQRDSPVAA